MTIGYRAKFVRAVRRVAQAACPHYHTTLTEISALRFCVRRCDWCGASQLEREVKA